MFVAAWCAPCLVEAEHISDLENAAPPRRLIVAVLDGRERFAGLARARPSTQVLDMSTARAWRLFSTLEGGAAGLPISVMTNGAGKPCAVVRHGIDGTDLARMSALCATPGARGS